MHAEMEVLLLATTRTGLDREAVMLQSPTHIHTPTHKRLLLAFVILKLLVKPLLSEVLTALSALLLPFLPRRGEGLQVDMTSLLPSGSQGRQAVTTHVPPTIRKNSMKPHTSSRLMPLSITLKV